MRRRWIIIALIAATLAGTVAVFAILMAPMSERIPGLKNPEKLVIYSIDGTSSDFRPDEKAALEAAEDVFGGCPILGKVEVTEQKDRNKLVASLQNGIVYHDGIAHKCFWPRHAILALENGQTFEIVICFQCRQYMLNGKGYPLISKRPEATFNEYLRSHDIPIAP